MRHPSARYQPRLAAIGVVLAVVVAGCAPAGPAEESPTSAGPVTPAGATDGSAEFAALESRFDARLGLYAVDTGTGSEVEWRADERFAHASTIKALAAAALLDRLGVDGLERQVAIEADHIVPHCPVTKTRVGGSMSLAELAEAAVTQSDNAAGNHLFEALGGPQALDGILSDLGDDVTVVARTEPDLNRTTPGDERDTTSPRAVAGNLREYVLGDTLSDKERALLTGWLVNTQTGDTLVRAGLPAQWRVADKSGAADYASRSDIAVVWPDGGAPIVIAVMSSRDKADADYDDALVAQAAAAAASVLRA